MSAIQNLALARTSRATPKSPIGLLKIVFLLGYGTPGSVAFARLDIMGGAERALLLVFLVFYPLAILSVLYMLVTRHYSKLYTPYDFREEVHFLVLARMLNSKAMEEASHHKSDAPVGESRSEATLGPLKLEAASRVATDEAPEGEEVDLPVPRGGAGKLPRSGGHPR